MKRLSLKVLLAVAAIVPLACPTAGWARSGHDDRWQGDRGGNHGGQWDPAQHYREHGGNRGGGRRLGRNDRIYRGGDGRYYCRRDDGTTGLVIGALAGGLLGNAASGNTLGTLLGAGGGALLGQAVDRGDYHCR